MFTQLPGPLKPETNDGANNHLNQTVLCCLGIVQPQTTFTVSNWCVRVDYMQVIKHLRFFF